MQSAVEWLVQQIQSEQNQKSLTPEEWLQVFDHAKQIEKTQLIEAACNNPYKSNFDKEQGEMYYHIMFKL